MRLASGGASLRCEFCNTVLPLAADDTGIQFLDEAPELLCPACGVPLRSASLARVQLHACKRCQGLLVAMSALQPLVEALRDAHPGSEAPTPADPADLERRIDCPQCHHRMDMNFYAGGGNVVVAGCERCELNWLDIGALMKIARARRASEEASSF